MSEGSLNIVQVLIKIQMILFDIRHHRHGGVHMMKACLKLTSLRQKGAALTDAGAAADRVQLTADMHRWVEAALHQHLREHGGRCGFAMGAADVDGVAIALHQLTQQLGTLHAGQAKPLHFHPFGIIRQDSGGIDHQISAMDVFGLLSDMDLDAHVAQLRQRVAVCAVGAGNAVALFGQHFRQSGHAGAADADHMNMLALKVPNAGRIHAQTSLFVT